VQSGITAGSGVALAVDYIGQQLLGWLGRGPSHSVVLWIEYSKADLVKRLLSLNQ